MRIKAFEGFQFGVAALELAATHAQFPVLRLQPLKLCLETSDLRTQVVNGSVLPGGVGRAVESSLAEGLLE
jgi:hypothetical protein